MSKQIELGEEAREKLIKGIDILADAVVSTLGPNGRNVLMGGKGSLPRSTKDGVSVAKSIELEDNIEDLGAQLVKQASIKTAELAGDGTTTSTLLARALIKSGYDRINDKTNSVDLKRGVDEAVKSVIKELQKNISEDIKSEDQIKQIASISANNDEEIGTIIQTALNKVGKDGIIHIQESTSHETFLETVEGMQFDRGYKSHYFVTDNKRMECVLENPVILLSNHKIMNVAEILPILEKVNAENKSILIIAEDIEHEALSTLIVNKGRGTLKVAAVKAPDFGDRRKLILDDIAALTGGVVFDSTKGMRMDKFNSKWFGSARSVTISKNQTTIVDGGGDADKIKSRLEDLTQQSDNAKSPYEEGKLQERIANLIGGVAIIHVGGNNETEMMERKDRVDDALQATKAALEEGIVPGGGIALLRSRKILDNNKLGHDIVYEACGKPFETILLNAGYESDEIEELKEQISSQENTEIGYNIKKRNLSNLKEDGIIDPAKVSRVALESAAGVAGVVLLTEAVIVDNPKEESPQIDMSQFGM